MKARWVLPRISSQLTWTAIPKQLVPLLLVVGCSSTSLNMEEREYARVEMYQEWQACKQVYMHSKAAFVSQTRSTLAVDRGLAMPHLDEMQRDMVTNRCRRVLNMTGYY